MNSENQTQDPIITRLITEIRAEDPCPEDVRTAVDRLKRRLGNRLAPSHSQATPSLRSRGSVASTRWRRPMLRLGIAAAVVGSVIVWQSMPTSQIGSGVAFGQVLDAIRQSTSMSYTMIDHPPEGSGESIERIQCQVKGSRWIRLVGGVRGIRIIDLKESKMLRFDDPSGSGTCANLFTFVGEAAQMMKIALGSLIEFNGMAPDDGEPLGHKMLDGQAVTGFRVIRPSLIDDLDDHTIMDIWADSETAQVVRVDVSYERDAATGTIFDFNFDVEFDDSLFDLQPPPGYSISYETIEGFESNDGK